MSQDSSLVYHPPSTKTLLALAWPIVVSRAAQTVVGFADAVMVAPLGEDALAAVTTGAMNAFLAFILPMGIVYIVGSFASQLMGRGEAGGAKRFGAYALVLAVLAEIVTVAGVFFVPTLVGLVDVSQAVADGLIAYLSIRLLSGGLVVALEGLGAYYGAIGNTRLPMVAQIVAMVLNIAFNAVLIHGLGPIPALGIEGAAWASVTATGVGAVVLITCFLLGVGTRSTAKISGLRVDEFFRVLRFGFPSGLNWFLEFAAFMYFIDVVVAGLGTTALAAFMAVMQLNSMSFMPAFGIASAGAVFVGQAIGANQKEDVSRIVWLTTKVSGTYQVVVGASYLLIPAILIAPFAQGEGTNATFINIAITMLKISAGWQLFDAVANSFSEALRAAGDTTFPLVARLIIAWVFFTPIASYAVSATGSTAAAMWSVVGYIMALAVVLYLRFRSSAWKRIALVDETLPIGPAPVGGVLDDASPSTPSSSI